MSQGTNLDLILSTDYLSTQDQKILQEKKEKEKISIGEGIKLAIQQEQILPSLLKAGSALELKPDYDFEFNEDSFKAVTKDIDPQYYSSFRNASSLAQAYQIRARILQSQEANKKLKTLGGTGTFLRVGAAVLDPLALVADAVTFGVARPFIYANRASRVSKYIRGGAVGAGQGGLITAPVVASDPTRDIEEIGYAMLMAGTVTGGLTRFLGPRHPDLKKFDSKSQQLGKAFERSTLEEQGFKITEKGEKYFGSKRSPMINENIDEVDDLLKEQKKIKSTKTNRYTTQENKMIDDIKENISADNLLNNFFDRVDKTPNVASAKFRFDKSSVLRRSDNPYMRSASEKLLEDSVGNVDYSRSILTADIHKQNYAGTRMIQFYKKYEPAFEKYMNEVKGKKYGIKYNLNDRIEFSNLVSRAIRGEVIGITTVNQAADATRVMFKKMLDDLKESGVVGAADILDNPNYFPRQWSISRIQDVQEKIGEKNVVNFLKNSLVKGSDNLSEADGLKIASKIFRIINSSKFGDGLSVDRILKTTDETELKNLIKDYTDLSEREIADLAKVLLKPQPPQVPARLRRRASFDETHEEIINNISVKLSDMLDNNTEGLVGSYINQMSGHVAFARVGIKSKDEYAKILDQIRSGYDLPEVTKKYKSTVGRARKKFELDTLETIYKNVIGIPTERDVQGGFATILRNIRKYNYANVFNQVGFAQIPELGNVIGTAGIRGFVKYIPEFKSIITRAKDGKLTNEFLDEIETLVSGTGSNRLIDSVINRTDDFAGMTTKVGKIEKTLDVATRITSDFSGFHAVDTFSRRLAAITSFDKLARHATGQLKLELSDIRRYKNIGFSEDELQSVFKNIRQNSSFIEGGLTGRKIRRLNVDQWKDQDLVNKMSLYMNRHLRRVIQENNYGEMVAMGADGSIGKTLLQFRNFITTAYSKQLLHGLHMFDLTAFNSAMSSAMIASLVYIAQNYVQAQGMSKSKREEFLEKRLSPRAIGRATFQRSTYSTLLPAVFDTGAFYLGQDPWFNYRSSGLDINLWTGNPTYSLAEKLLGRSGALRGIARSILDDEYDFSKRDAYKLKSVLPYQNMVGITNILQFMIDESDLPRTPN